MKLTLLSLIAPMLAIISEVESSGLRAGDEAETAIAAINGESDQQGERDLLDSWCAKDTPVAWHPDYSKAWNIAGCKYEANCNQVGAATEADCCAQYFGGQPSAGACAVALAAAAGPVTPKWYADYGTAWSIAGCKNTLPYPIYATTFFDTQLLCCQGAFGGQTSGKCIGGLANPPTSKPTVVGASGDGWYADYNTAWSIAGCKNTFPRPVYAIIFYDTQLACCKAAYGGQTSEKCIQGLPSPPTKVPTAAPTSKPTSLPTLAPTSKPTAIPTAAPACQAGGTVAKGGVCTTSPNNCCTGTCPSTGTLVCP